MTDRASKETKSEHCVKVIFFPDTRKKRGFGHYKRCDTLAKIASKMGFAVSFCINQAEPFADLLRNQGLAFSIVDWHEAQAGMLTTTLSSPSAQFINDLLPQIWIIDSYDADYAFFRNEAASNSILVVIDDNADREIDCDVVVNGNPFARRQDYTFRKNPKKMLVGGQYCLVPCIDERESNATYESGLTRILISFGGNGEPEMVADLVRRLEELRVSAHIKVVLPQQSSFAFEGRTTDCPMSIEYLPIQQSLEPLIRWSDFIVCSPSTTMYEAALANRPVICKETASNQQKLRVFLGDRGVFSFGPEDSVELLADACQKMTNKRIRDRQVKAIRSIGVRSGADLVMAEIMEVLYETVL